jgi:hypothetical protein
MGSDQDLASAWLPDSIKVSLLVTRTLEDMNIPYLIGGSLASVIHGKPRLTNDVDILADIKEPQISALVSLLESGFFVDEMAVRRAIRERSSFNIIYLETMFKVDIFIARGDTWSREQMRQREAKQLIEGDDSTFRQIANAETIILQKLWWFRKGGEISQKQWDDIIGVLEVRSDTLDYDYLQVWAAELGVSDLLKKSFTDAKIALSILLPPDTHTA